MLKYLWIQWVLIGCVFRYGQQYEWRMKLLNKCCNLTWPHLWHTCIRTIFVQIINILMKSNSMTIFYPINIYIHWIIWINDKCLCTIVCIMSDCLIVVNWSSAGLQELVHGFVVSRSDYRFMVLWLVDQIVGSWFCG